MQWGFLFFWHLWHSAQAMLPFSGICEIRYRRGAPGVQNGRAVHENPLLVYATRFQRHSVQKTGLWCTEWKFGAKNRILLYGTHLQKRGTASYCTGHIFKGAKQPTPQTVNSFLRYATRIHSKALGAKNSRLRYAPTPTNN